MTEVISLQDHIVEFEEGHGLFALKPQLHRIKCQHPVDGKMGANFLQQFDISKLTQPVMVVDHHGIGRAIAKGQKLLKRRAYRRNVGFDRFIGQHLADFVFTRRITNTRRAAAHDHDGLMAGLLQSAQQHDGHQISDMKRWRSRIEADISRNNLFGRKRIKRRRVGCLVDVAACIKLAKKIRFISSHSALAPSMEFRHWPIFR